MTKSNGQKKRDGGRPPSYDPNLVHAIISEGLSEGIPAADLDTAYVKDKLVKEKGVKSTIRPETLKGHVEAAHAEIAEAENKKLLVVLPDGVETAVNEAVAAAGHKILLMVARQHSNAQALAESACDELRADKRNAQYRICELEGELAQVKEERKTLEDQWHALAEELAAAREELRIAHSDLKRLGDQPNGIDRLLDELRNPEVRDDIRAALSEIVTNPAPPPAE